MHQNTQFKWTVKHPAYVMALKTYSEATFQSPSWKKLLGDLVGTCHRLFAITSAIGIQPPKKVKALPKKVGSGTEDSIDSSELASSEVDTCNIDILQPEYVREKLLAIANKNLQKKRKKKENYTVAQRNEEIILSPLKYSGISKYSNHPVEGKIQKTQTAPMKSPTHSQKVQFFGDFEKYSGRGDEPSSSALGSPSKADSMHTPHQTEKPSTHVRKQVNSEGTGINTNDQRTSVCKLQDHNVLVEETANAVVNRLMPLLGQEAEERLEKKPAAGGPPTVVLPTESIPIKDISRQIQYMLERVCKIEEEQKQNINVIGEVSRRLEQRVVFPENILQTAINQAQNVLNNLTRREEQTKIFDSHLRFPTTSITIGSPYGNIMKSDHEARPEKLLKTTSDGSSYVSQDNSLKNNFILNEVLHVPESGTITDQIKLQKEEFWASLVEQGFVKPPELAVDGVTAANKAVELMMEQNVPRNAVSKETAAFKITHHSTNVKRDAALAKVKKEDKATLVTSLMSSYSNSFEAESSEQTPCSSKLSDEGVSKKSFINTNVSTSVTEPDSENTENSRSGSYPSYDSESFSAKENSK
ncbi:uncharacterized protein LOC135203913 [Macrobrachium nipponense]|uniref:uncharacterized protein LOC135203913 n=1 Tax=Macrobrachium nipponense TaxID=159736 RepID=UPI0030C82D4D